MKNLTLREKIGQMLIIKTQGKEITNEAKRMIEEYKVVNRMPRELKNIKSAGKLVSKNNIEIIEQAGMITAQMLRESGFNMDYAPVLDIQRFEDGHAIGDRCYGKNAEEVSKNGIQIMKELANGGVIPVIKHFPGQALQRKILISSCQ